MHNLKGILPFHKYADRIASPIEEHMYECAYYAINNKSLLHFTVSQEHQSQFENIVKSVEQKIQKNKYGSKCYSFQNKRQILLQ
jgi:hypothetical protein